MHEIVCSQVIASDCLTAPCFQSINEVHSSYSGNRQTRTTTVTLAHAHGELIMLCIC